MFITVILPRFFTRVLFLNQQETVLQMKPYALCQEFQCKRLKLSYTLN